MKTFDEINDATGFANGERFANVSEVFDYFTQENILAMFGPDHGLTDEDLIEMTDTVITNSWHMEDIGHNS